MQVPAGRVRQQCLQVSPALRLNEMARGKFCLKTESCIEYDPSEWYNTFGDQTIKTFFIFMLRYERLPTDILLKIPEAEKALARDNNVIFAYIFGGLAEGRVKPLSDVDISVFLRDAANLVEYKLDLFNRLANSLGTCELDLVVLNTAPISIAGRILQRRQILVDKEPFRRHSYESVRLREFFDFRIKEEAFFARRYGIGRQGRNP